MPRSYPPEVRRQVIELARAGTRVQQLSVTFGMTETTIYNWLKQERVDRGEEAGRTTDQQLELAAAASDQAARNRAGGGSEGQRGVLERGHQPKRLFPVIESLTGRGISVVHACRMLGVSESGYYG